jgi:hypothetical protein
MHKNAKMQEHFPVSNVKQHLGAEMLNTAHQAGGLVRTRNAGLAGCRECDAPRWQMNRHVRNGNLGFGRGERGTG